MEETPTTEEPDETMPDEVPQPDTSPNEPPADPEVSEKQTDVYDQGGGNLPSVDPDATDDAVSTEEPQPSE